MSETKFTPGPWEVEITQNDDGETVYSIVAQRQSDGSMLLLFTSDFNEDAWEFTGETGPNGKADASLIAAGPELYAELEKARRDLNIVLDELRALEDLGDELEDDDAAIVDEIQEQYARPSPALAKARGEK